jgi:hypothetical protein
MPHDRDYQILQLRLAKPRQEFLRNADHSLAVGGHQTDPGPAIQDAST